MCPRSTTLSANVPAGSFSTARYTSRVSGKPSSLSRGPEKHINCAYWLVVGPPLWKIWTSIGMIRNPKSGEIKFMATKPPTGRHQVNTFVEHLRVLEHLKASYLFWRHLLCQPQHSPRHHVRPVPRKQQQQVLRWSRRTSAGGFPNLGLPQNGWFVRENPI